MSPTTVSFFLPPPHQPHGPPTSFFLRANALVARGCGLDAARVPDPDLEQLLAEEAPLVVAAGTHR
uniref:Uncharacterized protein n=1 Tax=Arundo donax TaxID=35708 RepID=A0A0A9CJ85_ARUDO